MYLIIVSVGCTTKKLQKVTQYFKQKNRQKENNINVMNYFNHEVNI